MEHIRRDHVFNRFAVGGDGGRETAFVLERKDGRLIESVAEPLQHLGLANAAFGVEVHPQTNGAFDAELLRLARIRDGPSARFTVDLGRRLNGHARRARRLRRVAVCAAGG